MKDKIRKLIHSLTQEWNTIKAKATSEDRALTAEETTRGQAIVDELANLRKQIQLLDAVPDEPGTPPPVVEPRVAVHDRAMDRPWGSFGEFLAACYRAAAPDIRQVDPRLLRAASGANESIPADGGFLVAKDFSNEVMTIAHQAGQVAARCRTITVGGNGLKINVVDESSRANGSRWGGVQAFWKDEAAALEESKPKFAQVELSLNKLTALFYGTDEVLADAAALGQLAAQAFGEELAFKLDDAIINGDGAGKPLGVLNAGCLVSITKETGQAASTILYENIVKMYARCHARSRANAVWLVNQDVEPQLFTMSLAVGTGGAPVYMPAGGASAAPYGTLLGRPVVAIEQCQSLGTVGDIILADLSQYLLINKGGVQSDSSIHVRFLYGETVFRFVTRVDGQPWWPSALTPANGSNSLSPFVALGSRS